MDVVEEAIDDGAVKQHKAFSAWAKEVKRKTRPKNPLKSKKRKSKPSDSKENSLVAAIR